MVGRFRDAMKANERDEAVDTLEKTLIAFSQALNNGYKIEMPPRYYGKKTDLGRIS